MTQNTLPPGPRRKLPVMLALARDPIGAHLRYAREYGDVFTLPLMKNGMVVTGDPEVARDILALPADAFETIKQGSEILGEYSIVRLDGDMHHTARRKVAPLVMNPMRGDNGQKIQDFADAAYAQAVSRPVRMSHLARELTMTIILSSVLGITERKTLDRFGAAFAEMNSKVGFILFFVPALQLDLGAWSPWGKILHARGVIDEIIQSAIENAPKLDPDVYPLAGVVVEAAQSEVPELGLEALSHQILTLLSAGHSSTAEALSWAVYHVFSRPDLLADLRDEAAAEEGDTKHIVRHPLLDAVCREVLRIAPIGPMIGRNLAQPIDIKGYRIPAGTMIGLSVPLLHHVAENFPDPTEFRPERFLDPHGPAKSHSLPFGGGQRHCLGAQLALTELKLALNQLFVNYDVTLLDTAKPKHIMVDAIAGPKGGVQVVLSRRR